MRLARPAPHARPSLIGRQKSSGRRIERNLGETKKNQITQATVFGLSQKHKENQIKPKKPISQTSGGGVGVKNVRAI